MSPFVFHNKFHRSNHHTIALSGFPDSATDSIASSEMPFLGIFYNNVYDYNVNFLSLNTSYNWATTYNTVTSRTDVWNKYITTYTTVCSFSARWNNNISLYNTYNTLSSKWQSFQDTAAVYLDVWDRNFENAGHIDRIQEYTGQKTFSAIQLEPNIINPWTLNELPDLPNFNQVWNRIVFGNGVFVAISRGGTVVYSYDGINWNNAAIPNSVILSSMDWRLHYGNNMFVALARGVAYAIYSYNGINWMVGNTPVSINPNEILYADGKFVAVGSFNAALYSYDGINWIIGRLIFNLFSNWISIIHDGRKFIVVASNRTTIFTSQNGIDGWTPVVVNNSILDFSNMRRIAYGNGIYIITRTPSGIFKSIYYSYNLNDWYEISLSENLPSTFANPRYVKYLNGYFFILSNVGNLLYSKNGLNWQRFDLLTQTTYNDIVYGNGLYIAYVGQDTNGTSYKRTEYTNDFDSINWPLSSAQVATCVTTKNVNFSGFSGAKKGGKYNLLVYSDATCDPSLRVKFNPDVFKFPLNQNSYTAAGINARKFEFLFDGQFLLGKSYLYNINPPDRDLYYAGAGISIFENSIPINPISLDLNESFSSQDGQSLIVNGSEPYESSASILISKSTYDEDFIFTFTTLSAASARQPFGPSTSFDRVNIVLPDNSVVNAINPLTASKSIFLTRCDPYKSIEVVTRSYGYISELIINDVVIKDFIFNPSGYTSNETGHSFSTKTFYSDSRIQSYFVRYGRSAPTIPSLSAGLALWIDALDYSTVRFQQLNGLNYVTSLSSKISGSQLFFTNNTTTSSFYNLNPKQSINYSLSSTHFRNLILSGNIDFSTYTVFTPSISSNNIEWIWANANYGIFKIPQKYAVGVGTLEKYYEYEYGILNMNKPICISTRCLSGNPQRIASQAIIINDSIGATNVMPITAQFADSVTMIGGKNQTSGFSNYKLHELILFRGYKDLVQVEQINDYLLDKWKFL